MTIEIREMKSGDLVAADSLRNLAGWNQTATDWNRILNYQPNGCFVAVNADRIVGTVTTTCYGRKLAWIGMMLVHPDFRRRGIGTALMERALDFLTAQQIECVKLDATPAGRPVYERLGFKAEWSFHRWQGLGLADSPVESISNVNGSSVQSFDEPESVFGACRELWLQALAVDSTVERTAGGFGMLRTGSRATYLGPVSAQSCSVAESLIGTLLRQTSGPVFWDIPSPNEDALLTATALGFQPTRELTRMWTGKTLNSPDLSKQYALSDPGMG